jgi:hypothetical protein
MVGMHSRATVTPQIITLRIERFDEETGKMVSLVHQVDMEALGFSRYPRERFWADFMRLQDKFRRAWDNRDRHRKTQ